MPRILQLRVCTAVVIVCLVQAVTSHISHSSRGHPSPLTCHHPNYQFGCPDGQGGSDCDFTVSWWSGEGEGVKGGDGEGVRGGLVNINFTAKIPQDKKLMTASLTLSRGEKKGLLTCNSYSFQCSNSLTEPSSSASCLSGSVVIKNHSLQCSFVIPDISSWQKLLSSPAVLEATSTGVDSTAYISQATSDCPCTVTSCSGTCSCMQSPRPHHCHSTLSLLFIRSHGVMMVVAFLLLLPTAVVIARYHRLTYSLTWFRSHVVTMVIGVVFALVGLGAIFGHTRGTFTVGFHQVIGVLCLSLAVIQPLGGFLRPSAGQTLRRRVFNVIHRSMGVSVIGLGMLNLVLGVLLFHNSLFGIMMSLLLVAMAVEGVLVVAMEIMMRRNDVQSPPVGYQRVQLGREEEEEEEEMEEMEKIPKKKREREGEGECGESESDKGVYVREDMVRGGRKSRRKMEKEMNSIRMFPGQYWIKKSLLFFIVLSFAFSAITGFLISYGEH